MRVKRTGQPWHLVVLVTVSVELWIGGIRQGWCQDGWPLITRQPYVQMVTEDSAVVVWRSERPMLPIVVFGHSPDELVNAVAPNQIVQRVEPLVDAPADLPRLHSANPGTHQYEAHIKGLQPYQTYYYAILDFVNQVVGGDERHRFRTSPETGDDRPARFWVVGDSGDGSVGQHEGYQGFLSFLENEPEEQRRQVDAYIHVGDMAYTAGGDPQFSANFFGVYSELLRNTCCWPSMGNHEGSTSRGDTGIGPYYDAYVMPTRGEAGGVPSGTEAYYSFDFGNIHFICLNSHDLDRSPVGAMAQWLAADLEETRADWLIAFWHHPPYTKGTHDSDREIQLVEMRAYIMPMLESAGVDLVLCGHSHTYERSMLIDGAYATPTTVENVVLDDGDGDPAGDGAYRKSPAMNPNEGSVSVVAGHGRFGGQFYGFSPVMRRTIPIIGSFLLDVDGAVLTGRMLDTDGAVRDTFQIVKDTPVQPVRLEHPWRPFGPGIVITEREPGIRNLEMFAAPAAPDAIVRYEINGDEVTELSPVYTDPIPIAATDASVQARTYWNAGTRVGPASTMLIPELPRAAQNQQAIVIPIESGRDDATETLNGEVNLDGDWMQLGNFGRTLSALRFAELGIPPEAIIFSATIEFHSGLGSSSPTQLAIHLEDVPNPSSFAGEPFALSSRKFGAESVQWNPRTWAYDLRGFSQRSPNFASLLQRHIARHDWTPGNALAISLAGTGIRDAWTFDRDPALAAILQVTFDTRDVVTIAMDQPFVVIPISLENPDGSASPGMQIQHRELAPELPGQDLAYQIEMSPLLDPASWTPLPDSELIQVTPVTNGPWADVRTRFPLSVLPDSPQYFFRLRITRIAEIE